MPELSKSFMADSIARVRYQLELEQMDYELAQPERDAPPARKTKWVGQVPCFEITGPASREVPPTWPKQFSVYASSYEEAVNLLKIAVAADDRAPALLTHIHKAA